MMKNKAGAGKFLSTTAKLLTLKCRLFSGFAPRRPFWVILSSRERVFEARLNICVGSSSPWPSRVKLYSEFPQFQGVANSILACINAVHAEIVTETLAA